MYPFLYRGVFLSPVLPTFSDITGEGVILTALSSKMMTLKEVNALSPELFKFIRQSRGLSQAQFAEQLRVSRSLVSLIELGHKPVTQRTYSRLRRLYGDDYIEACEQFIKRYIA